MGRLDRGQWDILPVWVSLSMPRTSADVLKVDAQFGRMLFWWILFSGNAFHA